MKFKNIKMVTSSRNDPGVELMLPSPSFHGVQEEYDFYLFFLMAAIWRYCITFSVWLMMAFAGKVIGSIGWMLLELSVVSLSHLLRRRLSAVCWLIGDPLALAVKRTSVSCLVFSCFFLHVQKLPVFPFM